MRLNSLGFLASASLLLGGRAGAAGFLSNGPGSRAAALGGAFTALADDSSAVFYNPAGLAGQRSALMFEHVPITDSGNGLTFGDGRLNFLGIQFASRIGTFGLSVYQFAIGDIEGRATLSDQPTKLSATQTAYFLPYAANFGRLSVGATAKAVTYSLGGYRAGGYGADLGARALLFRGDTRVGRETSILAGVGVRNALAPRLKLYQEAVPLERITTAGLALTANVRERYDATDNRVRQDRIVVAFDIERGNLDTPLGIAVGGEYAFLGQFAIRGGLSAKGDLTFGLGFSGAGSRYRVDYGAGLTPLAPQHRFSLSWFFSEPPAAVESDVRLSALRRATLDQARLKDRFLREGREAAAQGLYADAAVAFQKAAVLDPGDRETRRLLGSAEEGNRLAGVKMKLDAARREHAAGNDPEAARFALEAIVTDPYSPEAAQYATELRNAIIGSASVPSFDNARARMVAEQGALFDAALIDRNITKLREAVRRVTALAPDDLAAARDLGDRLHLAELGWAAEYEAAASSASAREAAIEMARAVRRLRRINPNHPGLTRLSSRVAKLSKTSSGSFYDKNYLRQLYDSAAADYALGAYDSARDTLSALLRKNAVHPEANALIDRMRVEGRISEAQEP